MTSGEREGDFSISLSSDVIAEVMGKHFNKEMFKKAVEIVDLKPLPDGYQFLLAYVQEKPVQKYDVYVSDSFSTPVQVAEGVTGPIEIPMRAKNGRFTKKETE